MCIWHIFAHSPILIPPQLMKVNVSFCSTLKLWRPSRTLPALADCPAMSFVLVCWHSRKWWPPIRGGLAQMLVLWLEKLNQIDSFCKIGIMYAWEGPRSIKRGKKHGTVPKITVFPRPLRQFLGLAWNVAASYQDKLILAWNVAATNQVLLWTNLLMYLLNVKWIKID